MHILFITSWYKTPKEPITGTFFEEQARMLQKKGHQVGIIFPKHDYRFLGRIRFEGEKTPHSFIDNEIPTYYSFTQSLVPKVDYPTSIDLEMSNRSAYKVYKDYVSNHGKPDIIHAHSAVSGGVLANYISKKENIPYFLTEHFSGWILMESRRNRKAFRDLFEQVVNESQNTFIVSSFYKNKLLENYGLDESKLKVIHNTISPIFYQNRTAISVKETIKLIIVGYLVEAKNHINLFKALQLLKQKGLDIELNVIGDGIYRSILEDVVKQNDLSKQVKFLGLLDRQAVLEQLKQSHILVSASIFETFGVNIIEAMAMGRPVVVYNSGGPEDIVRPQDGVLFHENNPKALAKAIQSVIDNYASYDQMQIAEDCMARFGEENIYKQLANYYNKVV